ncbi:MAG: hypothetical protein IT449_06400 [Phycisphaerales bacterium]|nr:hypothetical protein [Phycisphaerales bacterium]
MVKRNKSLPIAGLPGWVYIFIFCMAWIQAENSVAANQSAGGAETNSVQPTDRNPPSAASAQSGSSFLLSSSDLSSDYRPPWSGFLTGLGGFDGFAEPMGNPLYFESPFIDTNLRLLYLWHDFASNSQIGGGQVHVVAAQARLALTDRLAFIATKDGYSWLDAGILPEAEGWNDISVGLKYAFWVDPAQQWVATGGLRWEWHNGDQEVLQGGDSGDHELSPFVSFAKGWDRFHFIGTLNARLPVDRHDGNFILSWDLHFDYEVAPETLPGFFPLLEIHALHYLSDGDRYPLAVGGLDYTNLGSYDVAGTSVFWGDLGFRWKLTPNWQFGAAYGFPISNPGDDLFNQRVTVDLIFSF